jgi:hypothetical protein
VKIPRDEQKSGKPLRVVGYEAKVKAAVPVLAAQIAALDALTSVDVDIHPDIHRRIIGAKGANVATLQTKFGVRINFPKVAFGMLVVAGFFSLRLHAGFLCVCVFAG